MRVRPLAWFLVAVLLTTGFWRQQPARVSAAAPPYLVVIVMDGFRPDYETLAPMHHLHALMQHARVYDTAWVGQLESETPAGHATIATGVYPRKHGVIGFGWRDRQTGQFTYMPTNLGQIEAGDLSQTVEQGGVPTISDLIHARNKRDTALSISGEKLWASAPMGVGADYVLYGHEVPVKPGQNKFRPYAVRPNLPPARTHYMDISAPTSAFAYQDGFAARLAVRLVAGLRPRALLLNLPATDIAGHYYGGMADPKDMRPIIKGVDWAIGQVVEEYKRLGLYDHTVFVVTADHGMVAGFHRVPGHFVKQSILHTPASIQNLDLHNSLGSLWLNDPQDAGTVAPAISGGHFAGIEGALFKVPDGSGWTFKADAWTEKHVSPPLLRAYLDLADTEASVSGADVLLPYRENTIGLPRTHRFSGMHGGFSWDSQHIPLIIEGPGVRPGTSHFPAKLVDIAPTIERLIGLKIPAGVDGVVLADAVNGATSAEVTAQQTAGAQRLPDVRALEAHSAVQSKADKTPSS